MPPFNRKTTELINNYNDEIVISKRFVIGLVIASVTFLSSLNFFLVQYFISNDSASNTIINAVANLNDALPLPLPSDVVPMLLNSATDQCVSLSTNIRMNQNYGDEGDSNNVIVSLNKRRNLEQMILDAEQIFILASPKTGGTSIKEFAKNCFNYTAEIFIDEGSARKIVDEIDHNRIPPQVIVSHLLEGDDLIDIVRYSTKRSLVIVAYREETERLISAIRHVVSTRICAGPRRTPHIKERLAEFNRTHCEISYDVLATLIEGNFMEINNSNYDMFSCEFFDAIKESSPNLLFMDFKQLDELQGILAKNYCPKQHILRKNTSRERSIQLITVSKVNKRQQIVSVPFDRWIDSNKSIIEWGIKPKTNLHCKSNVRAIDDILDVCPDRTFLMSS